MNSKPTTSTTAYFVNFAVPVRIDGGTTGESQLCALSEKLGVDPNRMKVVPAATVVVSPDSRGSDHISPVEAAQHLSCLLPLVGAPMQSTVALEEENQLLRAEIEDLRKKLENFDEFKRETLVTVKALKGEIVRMAESALFRGDIQ